MKSIGTLYEECVFVGAGYGVSGKLRVSKYFSWWAGRRGGGVGLEGLSQSLEDSVR